MTKQELLNEIEGQTAWKGTPILLETIDNLQTYDVPVRITLQNGTQNKVTQRIYVENEGASNEMAYYGSNVFENWQEDAFVTNLRTAIDSYVAGNAEVLKVVVEQVNREKNFAIVVVYQQVNSAGDVEQVRRFVNGNSDETIEGHYPYIG
jgi:hypothetical protein